jgi:hypothetical protein
MSTPSVHSIAPISSAAVTLCNGFWQERLETNRQVTLPFVLRMCEESGRIANFAIAGGVCTKSAGWLDNRGEAYHCRDSDVFKVMEGAAHSLVLHPDPALERSLDDLIALVGRAQEPDGYLYTARTIDPAAMRADVEGTTRWSHLRRSHELYNVGHLYEAATAHFAATGKRTLLEIACKNADLIDSVFGPNGRRDVPGHQEIEIGLVKLALTTGERRYLHLAKFFLDERGRANGRTLHMGFDHPGHQQDHLPVVEQTEAVGHAVRATYMYTGMAAVAAAAGDNEYLAPLRRLWDNVVGRKLYLTGGLGARHRGESFGDDYELPNATAYAETCAAIGNMLWNQQMFLLFGDAKYIDVLELALYNGFLTGVSLVGDAFFYPNPLSFDGVWRFNKGFAGRASWFDCPCCPTNVVRFMASLPGLLYAVDDTRLYVNLFVASVAEAEIAGKRVRLHQETNLPWEGRVRLVIESDDAPEFTLAVRIPGWARYGPAPGDLYRYIDAANEPVQIKVNGEVASPPVAKGYVTLRRAWRHGDVVELTAPMAPRRVICHEAVEANRGRTALMRGPLVYCAEAVDNGGETAHLALDDTDHLISAVRPDLLPGGVTVVQSSGRPPITVIPYYAWANRGVGAMDVWLRRK